MSLWSEFLRDESGAILSAEAALVGTLGVAGAGIGLSTVASSIGDELAEIGFAFRSLDQSFCIPEQRVGNAWSAGSQFLQAPADESVSRLRKEYEQEKQANREASQQSITPAPKENPEVE